MKKQHFDNLVKNLRANGYTIYVNLEEPGYRLARVIGKSIFGKFSEPNNGDSPRIDNRFCFDNIECFDKLSKCPYSFPIPQTEAQFQYILEKMKYLATPDGYDKSNAYELPAEEQYPENIE